MPAKKHRPEEIIGKLREAEVAGRYYCGGMPPDRDQRTDLLSVAQGIWWSED